MADYDRQLSVRQGEQQSAGSQLNCNVCGAIGAGYHYYGLVCHGCRVFFIRQTISKRPKKIECKNDNNCVITAANAGNCRACRWRRCLEADMRPEEVGRQRMTRQSRPGATRNQTASVQPTNSAFTFYDCHNQVSNLPRSDQPLNGIPASGFYQHQFYYDDELRSGWGRMP